MEDIEKKQHTEGEKTVCKNTKGRHQEGNKIKKTNNFEQGV
jgi:hypothetical protein